jgi:Tfp pilus assembly protein PilF
MASPNREELYRMALNAAKNGQRKPAKVMLQKVLADDPKSLRAIMLMAKISNLKDRRVWLNRALEIDPDYDDAIEQLDKMTYQTAVARNKRLYRGGLIGGAVVFTALALVYILVTISVPI